MWITGFKDGMQPNVTLETAIDTTVVKTQLESMFGIRANPEDEYEIKYKQPYALFTPEGERLESRLSSIVNRVVFLFEGGQFIWPGVKIGHKSECVDWNVLFLNANFLYVVCDLFYRQRW